MQTIQRIRRLFALLKDGYRRLDKLEQAMGNIQVLLSQQVVSKNLQDYEFQVYSQNGEDGLIQYLIRNVAICKNIFVEFGVERYTESNTRFLLTRDYWTGLVIDGSAENIDYIQHDRIYWQHSLTAVQAFIDKDNINKLIEGNGITGEIGLLSIDIDGNDYWVWEAITCIDPAIVICEYNALFGPHRKVTVPYDKSFVRQKIHHSRVYYGASIAALADLAQRKGYVLVGSNRRGNNLFFVKKSLAGQLPVITPEQAYTQATFRESCDPSGNLSFLNSKQAVEQIYDMPLYDIETDTIIRVSDINR